MTKYFPLRRICRLLPPAAFLLFIVIACLQGGCMPDLSCICAYLSATGVMMVFCPLSCEDAAFSLGFEVLAMLSVLAAEVVFHGQYLILLQAVLALSTSLPVVFAFLASRKRFLNLPELFLTEAVQRNAEDYARFFHMMLAAALSALALLTSGTGTLVKALVALALLTDDLILYLRARLSCTLLLKPSFERKLKASVTSGIYRTINSGCNDTARVNSIYAKVIRYMDDAKPFLKDDYSIYDMARDIGFNRAYISHVINACSGKNFRQFINGYRIRYAVALMEGDRSLKVVELAVKSGFHSSVSFNMAFKLVMNESPGEYIKSLNRS